MQMCVWCMCVCVCACVCMCVCVCACLCVYVCFDCVRYVSDAYSVSRMHCYCVLSLYCRFRSMSPMYFRNAKAALIVFDVGKEYSVHKLARWRQDLLQYADDGVVSAAAAAAAIAV